MNNSTRRVGFTVGSNFMPKGQKGNLYEKFNTKNRGPCNARAEKEDYAHCGKMRIAVIGIYPPKGIGLFTKNGVARRRTRFQAPFFRLNRVTDEVHPLLGKGNRIQAEPCRTNYLIFRSMNCGFE